MDVRIISFPVLSNKLESMRLSIDRDLVQLVSGQLPNISRHLDELTHEPSIWQCDTGQWLSCFDSCQLTILWMANIKDVDLPRHAWDTPPFLLIVSPTLPVQSVDAYVRTLGQSRDNQTKRGWPYFMSMRLCPTRASRKGASLLTINPRKATGPDCVSPSDLKRCREPIIRGLQPLFKLCLVHSRVPSLWKTSRMPLFIRKAIPWIKATTGHFKC